jgi:hypothetical protein
MADEQVAEFVAITSSSPERAAQYLNLADNNLEQALQLYFDSGGVDLAPTPAEPSRRTAASNARSVSPPPNLSGVKVFGGYKENRNGVIEIESDDDDEDEDQAAGSTTMGNKRKRPAARSNYDNEDDEAMARRLQEELYAGEGAGLGGEEGVRAPIARTRETLIGPDWGGDTSGLPNVMQQLADRRARNTRPGIFNQRQVDATIWDDNSADNQIRQRVLSRATGGASDLSSKSSTLAEMYRPPFELMSQLPWDGARQQGREGEKWIMVNVQDPSIFDCQVLNRDIWKNAEIKEVIREHFIFLQYSKGEVQAAEYIQYYFQNSNDESAYPYIAIIDPRTGELIKTWSGPPVPKANQFLMDLVEFLDRYSLADDAKNPVAKRKPVKKELDVARMTEEEQFRLAMENSLANTAGSGNEAEDPDELTKSISDLKGKGKQRDPEVMQIDSDDEGDLYSANGKSTVPAVPAAAPARPFETISSTNPQTEPEASTDPKTVTRIQFRHPGGRVIRKFIVSDSVRRIYEWLKASPIDALEDGSTKNKEFELLVGGKNLIDHLDETIEGAGLKNQTVMIEYLD